MSGTAATFATRRTSSPTRGIRVSTCPKRSATVGAHSGAASSSSIADRTPESMPRRRGQAAARARGDPGPCADTCVNTAPQGGGEGLGACPAL